MFDTCLDENRITSSFWHIKPHEKRLFQKKIIAQDLYIYFCLDGLKGIVSSQL